MKKQHIWGLTKSEGARPPLYTLDELAEALGKPKNALARLATRHGIQPEFPTRPYKYPRAAFQEALNKEAACELYKVDQHIPIPPRNPARSPTNELMVKQLKELKVGDSFQYSEDDQQAVYKAAKQLNLSIVTRQDGFHRRVWLTEKPASN